MDILNMVLQAAIVAVGGLIARSLRKPRDHERAELLARIASDAAALTISVYPGRSWPELLRATIERIKASAGLPTQNNTALENAAAAALANRGVPLPRTGG